MNAVAYGTVGAEQALSPVPVKTSAYTASPGDLVPCDISAGNFTVKLPQAPADQTRVGVKVISAPPTAKYALTVQTQGSDVINKAGTTSGTLTLLYQGVIYQYDQAAAIWYVTGDDLPLPQLDARYRMQYNGAPASFYVNEYGADPAGTADSTTAVVNAATAAAAAVTAGAPKALVVFGAGSYKLTGGNIATTGSVGFAGPGAGACTILAQGSGKIFARTNTASPATYGEQAPVSGMTIDGTGCGSSAAYGLYDTDIGHASYQDLKFQNFTGSGSAGLVQYLASYWAEQVLGMRLWFENCTVCHLQNGGTASVPSFDYSDFFGVHYNLYPGQTGRLLEGNAPAVGGSYRVHVNCHASSGAAQTVWQIGSSGTDTSAVLRGTLDITGEVDGSGSTCHDFGIGADAGLYGFGNVQLNGFTANSGLGTALLVGSIGAPSFARNILDLVPVGSGPGTAFGGWTTSTFSYALRLPISGGSPAQGGNISSGNGAPTTNGNQGDIYIRLDTPSTSGQRIYVNTSSGSGTTWTGII